LRQLRYHNPDKVGIVGRQYREYKGRYKRYSKLKQTTSLLSFNSIEVVAPGMQDLITFFSTSQIQWIVTLIVIDVVLGIIAALLKKEFRLGKLANFMGKPVVGYVFGFVVLEMVSQAQPSLSFVTNIAFTLIGLALIGSILNNLGKMGLPLSSYLKKE